MRLNWSNKCMKSSRDCEPTLSFASQTENRNKPNFVLDFTTSTAPSHHRLRVNIISFRPVNLTGDQKQWVSIKGSGFYSTLEWIFKNSWEICLFSSLCFCIWTHCSVEHSWIMQTIHVTDQPQQPTVPRAKIACSPLLPRYGSIGVMCIDKAFLATFKQDHTSAKSLQCIHTVYMNPCLK